MVVKREINRDLILRKLKSVKQRGGRWAKAAKVICGGSYSRVESVGFDSAVVEHLWSEQSVFSQLLRANTQSVVDADRIVKGDLRVFHRVVNTHDRDFSWHKDIFSGHVYPKVPYPIIKIKSDQGSDIIVAWELSRLQFVPTLISAHMAEQKQAYVECFEAIVSDWTANNPLHIGANWVCSMDVAIRAINLLLGLTYFERYLKGDASFYRQVLWSHAKYIYANDLKWHVGPKNNHFLISMVGLLAMGLCFAGDSAEEYYRLAVENLRREIGLQFKADGGNFESASNYHFLTLEGALVGLCFQEVGRLGASSTKKVIEFGDESLARLGKAVVLVSDYLKAFGRSPQFGDSSDGRVLMYKDYFRWNPLDHSLMDELGSVAFGGEGHFSGEVAHKLYADCGYGFFVNDRYGVCMNASQVEAHNRSGRGHNHCDKGSVVLQATGKPFLIDSGTYCYTPDIHSRYEFKRTQAHNVVMVDGLEQAAVRVQGVFEGPEQITPWISYNDDDGVASWTMGHDGYCRVEGLGRVHRKVACKAESLEIEENIEGSGRHKIEILWHVHPDIIIEAKERWIYFWESQRFVGRMGIPNGFVVSIAESRYSTGYLDEQSNQRLIFTQEADLPLTVRYGVAFTEE